MPRIVSLLPAGTEIVSALGAADQLVGRSHECDYPAEVQRLPIVSRPTLELGGLSQSEIDVAVSGAMRSGASLYAVDERLLRELAPDVILTQDLCQVCAPSGNELTRAVTSLPSKPEIVYLSPRTLAEIDENILTVGNAIDRLARAREIVAQSLARMDAVRERVRQAARRPRVTFLEWIDPPYCAGHWVPEMIDVAGGVDPLGRAGADSVRVTWSEIAATKPEVIVVAPCGFGLADAERMSRDLPALESARIAPVDANAFFARPGPRYVDGIELLERIFRGASAATAEPPTRQFQ